MPFRIENILKNETKTDKKPVEDEKKISEKGSILQQTLMNRLQPHHTRPAGHVLNVDNFHGYPCDRVCYSEPIYNPYFFNEYSYIYGRKYYSVYNIHSSIYTGLHSTTYSKRKGGQVRFTPNQTDVLEKRFRSNQYLSPEERKRLADNLKLSDKQVKTWFQNRRAKWRRSSGSFNGETAKDDSKKVKK